MTGDAAVVEGGPAAVFGDAESLSMVSLRLGMVDTMSSSLESRSRSATSGRSQGSPGPFGTVEGLSCWNSGVAVLK